MNEIRKSSQFKKDFKRIKNDITKVKLSCALLAFLNVENLFQQSIILICSKDNYKESWNVTLVRIFGSSDISSDVTIMQGI